MSIKKRLYRFFSTSNLFCQAGALKIPILMEVYEQAHAGKFKMSYKRTIKPKNIVAGTGMMKTMDTPVEHLHKWVGIVSDVNNGDLRYIIALFTPVAEKEVDPKLKRSIKARI